MTFSVNIKLTIIKIGSKDKLHLLSTMIFYIYESKLKWQWDLLLSPELVFQNINQRLRIVRMRGVMYIQRTLYRHAFREN